jgi:hypothetical protein
MTRIFCLTFIPSYPILWVLHDMTMNETSAAKVPDALSVVSCSNVTSVQASGTFSGLREDGSMGEGCRQANPVYPAHAAEAKDGAQVANVGSDVFELYGFLMVAEGRITETRMRRAVNAVRQAVQL